MKKLFLQIMLLLSFSVARAQEPVKDSSGFNIRELIISADRFEEKRKDIPRQVDVIQKKDIRFLNKQTTADLLTESGNVFMQKSQMGGGSPVIRGFEANRVLLVLDGIRLNNAIYRSGHLQNVLRLNQEDFEKAEVLYGAGSLIYGSDALGGVVHFVTRNPDMRKPLAGNVNMRYGNINQEWTQSLALEGGYKKLGYMMQYTMSRFGNLSQGNNRSSSMGTLGLRNYFQGISNDTDRVIANSDPNVQVGSAYNQQNWMAKLQYVINNRQKISFSYLYSNTGNVPRYDRLSEMKNGNFVYGDWYYGPEKFALYSLQYDDRVKRSYADEVRLKLAYQDIEESRNSRNFGSASLTRRTEKVGMVSLNLDLRKRNGIHELRYGVEMVRNAVSSEAGKYDVFNNMNYLGAASTRYPDGGSRMGWGATYISLSHELSEKWIITEGIRYSYTNLNATFTDKSFYSFLPDESSQHNNSLCGNIGAVYNLNESIRFYANTGNAFRTPNVDDMNKLFDSKSGAAMIIPNEALKPEKSWTSELGFNLIAFKKLELGMSAYYTALYDFLAVAPTTVNGQDSLLYDGKLTPVYSTQNMTRGYIYGYSAQLRYFITRELHLDATINYTYGRIKADSVMPLDHIPPLFGRSGLNYEHKRLRAAFYVHYSAAKKLKDYYLNGEDNLQYATANGMPSWYTLNITASYTLNKRGNFIAAAGIDNLLDRNYRTFSSGISAPGRNVWLNLRVILN